MLEGSVRTTSDRVRINVQLIDAENGAHLWADRFDTDRTNLPKAQNEIIGRLAAALHLQLIKGGRAAKRSRTKSRCSGFGHAGMELV